MQFDFKYADLLNDEMFWTECISAWRICPFCRIGRKFWHMMYLIRYSRLQNFLTWMSIHVLKYVRIWLQKEISEISWHMPVKKAIKKDARKDVVRVPRNSRPLGLISRLSHKLRVCPKKRLRSCRLLRYFLASAVRNYLSCSTCCGKPSMGMF